MKRKATVHGVAMNMEAQTSCWQAYSKLFGHTPCTEASRSHVLVLGETSIHRDPRELLFGAFLCPVTGNCFPLDSLALSILCCETSRMKSLFSHHVPSALGGSAFTLSCPLLSVLLPLQSSSSFCFVIALMKLDMLYLIPTLSSS